MRQLSFSRLVPRWERSQIKNHPFQNGNKRIAMTTLLVFLHKNGKWLRADIREFYKFTMDIASSAPENKDEYIQMINKFIARYLIDR